MTVPQAPWRAENPGAGEPERLNFAGFTLDIGGHVLVDAGGTEVALRRSEFALLVALVRSAGRVLSREFLLDSVAGRTPDPFDRSIDVLVGRLRKKIEEDPRQPRLIQTVAGVGYKFTCRPEAVNTVDGALPGGATATPRPGGARPAERRQLTVVHCRPGEAMPSDPEARFLRISAFQACGAEILERRGGTVRRRRQGGIVGYFGYPAAGEHDAERAVLAGLSMARANKARIGIATGEMLIGDVLGEPDRPEHGAIGEAADTAERLALATSAGVVTVSSRSRMLAGDLFDYRPADIGSAGSTFVVLGESMIDDRFAALRGASLTLLVGREDEIGLLSNRWRQASAGAGRLVLLGAEPGVGKSRLINEFRKAIVDEPHTPIRCFCSPHHRDIAYHPMIRHLERVAGIAASDGAAARLRKLGAVLTPLGATGEAITLIADLVARSSTNDPDPAAGLSPRQRHDRTASALLELLVAEAARRPVLLIFEDAQWLDPTSREVVDAIIDRIVRLPVLLVVTHRPEFTPNWNSLPHATTLMLSRLDAEQAGALVLAAGGHALPPETRQQIVGRADGVPLFVEELTRALLEIGPPSVPASLRDSLMARLDRNAAAKRAAQLGAAIGRAFSQELAVAIHEDAPEALERGLEELVASGLATRRGVGPEANYTFKHALVQEAAYESLLSDQRASIHKRIVAALIAGQPDIEHVHPGLLAHHYEHAGLVAQAVEHYTRAGAQLRIRGAIDEMEKQFGHALRLLATLPEGAARDKAELHVLSGIDYVVRFTKGYASPECGRIVAREIELCDRLGKPEEFIACAYDGWRFHMNRGDMRDSAELAERLSRWADEHDDSRAAMIGQVTSGCTAVLRGDFTNGRSRLESAATSCGSFYAGRAPNRDRPNAGDPTWEARTIKDFYLALVAICIGQLDKAAAHISEAHERSVRLFPTVPVYEMVCLRLLALFTDASELGGPLEQLAADSREHGFPLIGALATILKGSMVAHRSDPRAGRAMIAEGVAAYEATDAAMWRCYYRALLAEAHLMSGECDTALDILQRELDRTERIGERWYVAELHRRIGDVHRKLSDYRRAKDSFEQALAVGRSQAARLWELHAAVSYARLLRDACKPAEASGLLAPIYAGFSEGFDAAPLRAARSLLDDLNRRFSR